MGDDVQQTEKGSRYKAMSTTRGAMALDELLRGHESRVKKLHIDKLELETSMGQKLDAMQGISAELSNEPQMSFEDTRQAIAMRTQLSQLQSELQSAQYRVKEHKVAEPVSSGEVRRCHLVLTHAWTLLDFA